jgi:hypothetical protein
MRVEILRTPGTDLAENLAYRPAPVGGPLDIPKDLAEGDVVDLAEPLAEALIALGIAAKAAADKPVGKAADKPDKADKADKPAGKAPGHPPPK